jgi:hypothetical protein
MIVSFYLPQYKSMLLWDPLTLQFAPIHQRPAQEVRHYDAASDEARDALEGRGARRFGDHDDVDTCPSQFGSESEQQGPAPHDHHPSSGHDPLTEDEGM